MTQLNKKNLILHRAGKSNNIDFGVKVIVNQQTADGKGGLLWPAILRKLYLLYRYFDYDFTSTAGDAMKITKSALSEGYTTILTIGGKDTIRETIQGFFDKEYRLINPRARLVLFPLTFGSLSQILPHNAQNWYFLHNISESAPFLYQPHTIFLLDSANRKVRYSQRFFFEELRIQANEPSKIDNEESTFGAQMTNFMQNMFDFRFSLFESKIWVQDKGPMNLMSSQIWIQQQIDNDSSRIEDLQLKIGVKKNGWRHWKSFLTYQKIDKLRIEFYERVYLKIDGIWDDAFGIMLNPTMEKIKMHWVLYLH